MTFERKRIGLQIGSLNSGFRLDVFHAIQRYCKQNNLDLILFLGERPLNSSYYVPENVGTFTQINKNNVDVLISLSKDFVQEYLRQALTPEEELNQVPVLCASEECEDVPSVVSDFEIEYQKIINHMIDKHNCKYFNIVAGPKGLGFSEDRLNVCLEQLAKRGIKVTESNIFYGTFDENSGYGAMVYFMEHKMIPTDCIICLNDDMAEGVLNYVESHNLSVPEDFKLVGFDGIFHTKYGNVTLTTLSRGINKWAACVVDKALCLANGTELPLVTKLPCFIRYRKSCGCVDKNNFSTNYIDNDNKEVPFTCEQANVMSNEYFSLEHDVFMMQRFFEDINELQTIASSVLHLKTLLPVFHIRSCAVVLFEKKILVKENTKFELPSRAELMLGYDEIKFKAPDNPDSAQAEKNPNSFKTFNPCNSLVPEGTFSDRRRVLITKPLFFQESLFGYIVYEPGDYHPVLYQTLFAMVATSLNSAIIFTEKSATERHQSDMLQQLESTNTQLSDMSLTDELTKLYNRRGLITFGSETMDLALEMEKNGIVVYADMDGLKSINDTFGHDAGDVAIKTMGEILKKTFRNQDVIGRMGGDEFVVVATGIGTDFMPKILERIKYHEEQWFKDTNSQFRLGISLGAVDFNLESHDLDTLLGEADKLLYQEKVKKHSRSAQKQIIQ